MPWSPLKYKDEIFENIRKKGYTNFVTTKVLKAEIMRATGLIRDETISNVIRAFETLGYIELSPGGVWEIKYMK